jgi:hypothetical protein
MKAFNIMMAIALVALVASPVIASSSVELSTERGEVRGYFSGDHDQMSQPLHSDVAQLSNEKGFVDSEGFTDSDVRGYFSTDHAATTAPDVEKSIEQSRENGGA